MKKKKLYPHRINNTMYKQMRYFTSRGLKKNYEFVGEKIVLTGPTIIMANHTTDSDLFFVMQYIRDYMHFVFSEHLVRKSKVLLYLTKWFDYIALKKGGIAPDTSLEIMRKIKQGKNICIFPEGTRSFDGLTNPIKPATGKLVKTAKCNLITIRFEGGYFVEPKWALNWRNGKITGTVMHNLTAEQLKDMSAEEIYKIINDDLYVDAQKYQDEHKYVYKGKKLAEGIENVLYMCPKCHKLETINSKNNKFSCSECDYEGYIDEYGYIHDNVNDTTTVKDMINKENEILSNLLDDDNFTFVTPKVTLNRIDDNHKTTYLRKGELTYKSGKLYIGDKEFECKQLAGCELVDAGNRMLVTYENEFYELISKRLGGLKLSHIVNKFKDK